MWLRAAVINAFVAGLVMMSHSALGHAADDALRRQAAQIALMHAMATIACATLMNMGASSAARVPPFFVLGTVSYSVPIYLSWPQGRSLDVIRLVGAICMLVGWLTMFLSTWDVDRHGIGATPPDGGATR